MYAKKNRIKMAAQKYVEEKLWEKAILELKKLIYLDEEDISSRIKIADLYAVIGDNKSAVDNYIAGANFYANRGLLTKVNEILKKVSTLKSSTNSQQKKTLLAEKNEVSSALPSEDLSHTIPLFSDIKKENIEKIHEKLKERRVARDTVVISEGERNDSLYIVKDGVLKVTIKAKDKKNKFLTKLFTGDFFGELSLLTGAPRSATITTMTDSILQELTRKDFEEISARFPEVKKVLVSFCKGRARVTKAVKSKGFGQRKFERVMLNLHITYTVLTEDGVQDGGVCDGIVRNISLGGLCVEVDGRDSQFDDPLLLGKTIRISLSLPGDTGRTIHPKGRFVWSQQAEDDSIIGYRYLVGVIFTAMKEADLMALKKALTRLQTTGKSISA